MNELDGLGDMNRGPLWRNVKERAHLQDLGVDGRIILGWIFTKYDWEAWSELIWHRTGQCPALQKWSIDFWF